MSELQSEYQGQPLKRMAKVYQFPTLSRFEVDELTYEQEMRDQQMMAALRAKAPLPWYKRLSKWYDENWKDIFEGFGPGLILITSMILFLVIFVQLGKLTGWWGGGW